MLSSSLARTVLLAFVGAVVAVLLTLWKQPNPIFFAPKGRALFPGRGAGTFALGVKTCGFYHATRTAAVERTFAHRIPHRLYASDVPNRIDSQVAARTVVEKDWVSRPYVPPWAQEFQGNIEQIRPHDIPQLKRRVLILLRELHDRFVEEVEWFVIIDDDTFVRPKELRKFLSTLDPAQLLLVGHPVPSSPHL